MKTDWDKVAREREAFIWWRVMEDGTAQPFPESAAVTEMIDSGLYRGRWYGTVEGCILHGGVIATAIRRRREKTYSAHHWLVTGNMKEDGEVIITEVTAEPAGEKNQGKRYEKRIPKQDGK